MGQSASSVAHRASPHRSRRASEEQSHSIEPNVSSQTFPLPKPPDRAGRSGRNGQYMLGEPLSRSTGALTPPQESGFAGTMAPRSGNAAGSVHDAGSARQNARPAARIDIPRNMQLAPAAAGRRMLTPQEDPVPAMFAEPRDSSVGAQDPLRDPCSTSTSPSLRPEPLRSASRSRSQSVSRAVRRLTTWLRPGSPARSGDGAARRDTAVAAANTAGDGTETGPRHSAGPEMGPVQSAGISSVGPTSPHSDRSVGEGSVGAEATAGSPPRYGELFEASEWRDMRGRPRRRNRSLPFLDFDSDSDSDSEWGAFRHRSDREVNRQMHGLDSFSRAEPGESFHRTGPGESFESRDEPGEPLTRARDTHGSERDSRDQAAVLGRLLAIAASITASSMFGARASDGVQHHVPAHGAAGAAAGPDAGPAADPDAEHSADDSADAPADEAPRARPGESFVAFLDSLLNGAYARELWAALFGAPQEPGERPAFFRMFRFPVDSNGLVPVLIVSMRQAEPRDVEDHDHVDIDGGFFRTSGSRSRSPLTPRSPFSPFHSRHNSEPDPSDLPHAAPHALDPPLDTPRANAHPAESRQSWIIVVFGGAFPADHPLFLAPSLLDENPTYEDLLVVEELLGQHKPPVASQQDLDDAGGVFTLDAASPLLKERCPVCLVDYVAGDACRELTCQHTFHAECVDAWLLKGQNSCPMCRELGVPKLGKPVAD